MTLPVRFTAHGHPALRASHAKTLEFTTVADVTERASCVVGVAAELPPEPVAGPIELALTLEPGSDTVTVAATGNSSWSDRASAVVRRSARRLPDTYATEASLAAADLPRPWLARLTDPTTALRVEVRRRPSDPWLVRFRIDASNHSRLVVEAAAADEVRAEDAGAARALAGLGLAAPAATASGGRVLAVSSTTDSSTAGSDTADEVIGWPPELALPAAFGAPGPVLLAAGVPANQIAPLAAGSPGAAVVFRGDADRLTRLVTAIGRPQAPVLYLAVDDPERPRRRLDPDERGEFYCLVGPVAERPGTPPVEPAELVRRLLGEGISSRSVALALAGLPGWSRRTAYDFVLSLAG